MEGPHRKTPLPKGARAQARHRRSSRSRRSPFVPLKQQHRCTVLGKPEDTAAHRTHGVRRLQYKSKAVAFIVVFRSLGSLLPAKHRDTHNLKGRGKSVLQTRTRHRQEQHAPSAFGFSQRNTFIISIFSQQEQAVSPPSQRSGPSLLQLPYSLLCPMVRKRAGDTGRGPCPPAAPPLEMAGLYGSEALLPPSTKTLLEGRSLGRHCSLSRAELQPALKAKQESAPRVRSNSFDTAWKSPSKAKRDGATKKVLESLDKNSQMHPEKSDSCGTQEDQLGRAGFWRTALRKVTKRFADQNVFSRMPRELPCFNNKAAAQRSEEGRRGKMDDSAIKAYKRRQDIQVC